MRLGDADVGAVGLRIIVGGGGGGATITEVAGESDGDGVDDDDRSWISVGVGVDSDSTTAVPAPTLTDAADANSDDRDDVLLLRVCGTSELADSSLCHLELVCRAVLICVQRSFLHDFDLLIDCNQSLN